MGGGKRILVSVIIPVYNTELYLRRCIDRVLNQTFEDFELILVDDGSTDESGAICDEIAATEQRIKVFHRENVGAGGARAFGVSQAESEWIMFSDSDDVLPLNSIEDLYNHKDKADIIVGSLKLIVDENTSVRFHHKVEGELSPEEYINALLLNKTSIGPVSKLFKRNIFQLDQWIVDRSIKNNEDLLMLVMLATKAKKIFIDDSIICYQYCYRAHSGRSNVSPINVWFKLFSIIESYIYENFDKVPFSFYIYELHRLYDCAILKGNMVDIECERVQKVLEVCESLQLSIRDKQLYKILKSPFRQKVAYLNFRTTQLLKRKIKRILNERQISLVRRLRE